MSSPEDPRPMDVVVDLDEEQDEADCVLTKVVSIDIEDHIQTLQATAGDCADVRDWYAECQGTVRQLLALLDDLQDAATAEGEGAAATSDDPEEDPTEGSGEPFISVDAAAVGSALPRLCYLSVGAEFDAEQPDHSVFVDYDLVAEKVLDRRRIEGVTMYKVQWKGHDAAPLVSWHPAEELECANLILKFEASRQPTKPKAGAPPTAKKSKSTRRRRCPIVVVPRSAPTVLSGSTLPGMVVVPDGEPPVKYQPVQRGTLRLFHGTRRSFAEAILEDGFKVPETRSGHGLGPVRPHMFGKGIYFTSNLEKARHFGDVVLVCEVLVGAQRVMRQADYNVTLTTLRSQGFDSIYAPPGCGGNVFDEYVVYHPGQIRVVGYLKA